MARSDIYKLIIKIFAVLLIVISILVTIGIVGTYRESLETLKELEFIDLKESEIVSKTDMLGWIVFFVFIIFGFIFCMFFYLLSDILDRLEIISAQTTRSTRVLEKAENEK